MDQATSYLLSRLTPKAIEVVLGERLDTEPLETAVNVTSVALDAATVRQQAAESKAIEAAQDPEVDLALLKILSTAQTKAQESVRVAEREHLAAQAAYQAARTKATQISLPSCDLSTAEGRKTMNEGLERLGLKISTDWQQQRWGLSLPGTEIVWSSFSEDSWLEFDWVGPAEELTPAAQSWLDLTKGLQQDG